MYLPAIGSLYAFKPPRLPIFVLKTTFYNVFLSYNRFVKFVCYRIVRQFNNIRYFAFRLIIYAKSEVEPSRLQLNLYSFDGTSVFIDRRNYLVNSHFKKIDGNRFHSWMPHSTHKHSTGVFISANANIECHRKWITVKHFIRHEIHGITTVYDGPVQIFAHNLDPIVIQQHSTLYLLCSSIMANGMQKKAQISIWNEWSEHSCRIRVPTHRRPSEVEIKLRSICGCVAKFRPTNWVFTFSVPNPNNHFST